MEKIEQDGIVLKAKVEDTNILCVTTQNVDKGLIVITQFGDKPSDDPSMIIIKLEEFKDLVDELKQMVDYLDNKKGELSTSPIKEVRPRKNAHKQAC